jgi:hypothetical protein
MSLVSLTSSIRNCNVNVADANRLESDRFLNPSNTVCYNSTGYNIKGQMVCKDSLHTKAAGCSHPMDMVNLENSNRPNYLVFTPSDSQKTNHTSLDEMTGHFGNQLISHTKQSCNYNNNYENYMKQYAENNNTSCSINQYSAHTTC